MTLLNIVDAFELDGFDEARYRQVLSLIRYNEDRWSQEYYHRTGLGVERRLDPSRWDLKGQLALDCGSSHCFAGWCDIVGGRAQMVAEVSHEVGYVSELYFRHTLTDGFDGTIPEKYHAYEQDIRDPTKYYARRWLGLTYEESDRVFAASNTLEDLHSYLYVLLWQRGREYMNEHNLSARDRFERVCKYIHDCAEHAWFIEEGLAIYQGEDLVSEVPMKYFLRNKTRINDLVIQPGSVLQDLVEDKNLAVRLVSRAAITLRLED